MLFVISSIILLGTIVKQDCYSMIATSSFVFPFKTYYGSISPSFQHVFSACSVRLWILYILYHRSFSAYFILSFIILFEFFLNCYFSSQCFIFFLCFHLQFHLKILFSSHNSISSPIRHITIFMFNICD